MGSIRSLASRALVAAAFAPSVAGMTLGFSISCSRSGAPSTAGEGAATPSSPPAQTQPATAQTPPAPTPTAGSAAGTIPPPPPGTGVGITALKWVAPADWKSVPPANAMRKAQYTVPGAGGDAECVIYYFGPQQGGTPQANAQRWASQFTTPTGSPAESSTRQLDVGGIDVLLIEAAGTYSGGFMGAGKPLADHRIVGAIAAGPDANWFFKLTGPDATVQAQRDAFLSLIQSLERGAAGERP